MHDASLPANILVVDDDDAARALLTRCLADEFPDCVAVRSPFEALHCLRHRSYSLVITDVRMPGICGTDLLHLIRKRHPDTAVIMITGAMDIGTAVNSLRAGAADFITKPFDMHVIRHSVQRALEGRRLLLENRHHQERLEDAIRDSTLELNRTLGEVEESYRITLEALVAALDAREHETQAHSQRVREYTLTLARRLDLRSDELVQLGRGALLHDVGKIGVPDCILLKPGPLSAGEWIEMRRHPRIGYDILKSIQFLEPAAEIVLCHQERWDGKGYPNGIAGGDIPLGARIFAVADTMDAMTSDRPYRRALSFDAAFEEIRRGRGTQFDPAVVDAFFGIHRQMWQTIHGNISRGERPLPSCAGICPT